MAPEAAQASENVAEEEKNPGLSLLLFGVESMKSWVSIPPFKKRNSKAGASLQIFFLY